jgi:hypothetical protein
VYLVGSIKVITYQIICNFEKLSLMNIVFAACCIERCFKEEILRSAACG